MNYAVGANMPGYLPEGDVWVTDDFDSAKRALIADILRDADSMMMGYDDDEQSLADDLANVAEDVNLWSGPDWVQVGNVAYWIAETDEPVEDDES